MGWLDWLLPKPTAPSMPQTQGRAKIVVLGLLAKGDRTLASIRSGMVGAGFRPSDRDLRTLLWNLDRAGLIVVLPGRADTYRITARGLEVLSNPPPALPPPIPPALPKPDPRPGPPVRLDIQEELLEATNAARSSYGSGVGRKALSLDDRLSIAAQYQADDCVALGRLTHDGRDGSRYYQRIARAGYPFRSVDQVQENAASGWATSQWIAGDGFDAAAAVQAWLNSTAGHRTTLLGDWDHAGAGRAVGSDGTVFFIGTYGRLR